MRSPLTSSPLCANKAMAPSFLPGPGRSSPYRPWSAKACASCAPKMPRRRKPRPFQAQLKGGVWGRVGRGRHLGGCDFEGAHFGVGSKGCLFGDTPIENTQIWMATDPSVGSILPRLKQPTSCHSKGCLPAYITLQFGPRTPFIGSQFSLERP